jgi:lysophospholipase L1-like esterase
MIANKEKLLINICLAVVSFVGCGLGGYYLYTQIKKPPASILFKDTNDEYLFSFYNQKGEKISDIEGLFKLVTDPFTIYRNYPNQKAGKYSINRHGFRDTYLNNNPYTAIVIGGSAALGFALNSNDQTFSSKISMRNEKYRIINAAVIGFLSGQELSQMIHYLDDHHPSLYIIFDGWNDIYDPFAFTKSAFKEKNLAEQSPIGFNNTFFHIESRLADYFQLTRKEKNSLLVKLTPVGDHLNESELFRQVVLTYTSNIGKMYSFANSRHARLLVILQPELGNKKITSSNEREVLDTWIKKYGYLDNKISERYQNMISTAKNYFQEKRIPFIDINTEQEFSENPQTLFFDVVHPNELGHEIIANIINRRLEENF